MIRAAAAVLLAASLAAQEPAHPRCPVDPGSGSATPAGLADGRHGWSDIAVAGADLRLDPGRVRLLADGLEPLLDRAGVERLAVILAEDPDWRRAWPELKASVENLMRQGGFGDLGGRPYVKSLIRHLGSLGLAYAVTGDAALGRLLRRLVLDLVDRPPLFFIDTTIRSLRAADLPTQPGTLETGDLAIALAAGVRLAGDLFDAGERERIRALFQRRLLPMCRNFVMRPPRNNWHAVLGAGALVGGALMDDAPARAAGLDALRAYLRMVEDDGGSSEQVDYLYYPLASVALGSLVLQRDELDGLLQGSPLAGSLRWIASHHAFAAGPQGPVFAGKVHFGDSDLLGLPFTLGIEFLARAYGQGEGPWLMRRIHGDAVPLPVASTWAALVLRAKLPAPPALAGDPAWPDTQVMDSGVAILRRGYGADGLVAALRSGGGGRTTWSHDRPNRNAIQLFALGEYLVAAPGRASYRSPLRSDWDLRPDSHSLVSVDGVAVPDKPVSRIAGWADDGAVAWVRSEAACMWGAPVQTMRRDLIHVKEPGYLLVCDTVRCTQARGVAANWLLNNSDGRAELAEDGAGAWTLRRPRADLHLRTAATVPLAARRDHGQVHTGYSYAPGDAREGTLGSGIRLRFASVGAVTDIRLVSVLVPVRSGASAPTVRVDGDGATLAWPAGEDVRASRADAAGGLVLELSRRRAGTATAHSFPAGPAATAP